MLDLIVCASNKINYTFPNEAAPRPTMKWNVYESAIDSGSTVDKQIYNSQVIFKIPFYNTEPWWEAGLNSKFLDYVICKIIMDKFLSNGPRYNFKCEFGL